DLITAHRQDAPPKFIELEYELRIVTGESERRAELLQRNIMQFGTIFTNTLAAACNVRGRNVATKPSRPGSPN
ncbi:MAG: hypothetical protein ACKVOG_03075, partial [Rhodoglobus sp.]